MTQTSRYLSLIAATALLFACNEHQLTPVEDSIAAAVGETSVPLTTNAVDILWVVDSSGSMEQEQAELGERFNEFLNGLADLDADFHLGVVTTDFDAQTRGQLVSGPGNDRGEQNCTAPPDALAYCADLDLQQPFLRRSDYGPPGESPDIDRLSREFRCLATTGTCGSGTERGLESLGAAVSPERIAGSNAGFLRDDAFLLVIILSDEDDCSNGGRFPVTTDGECYVDDRQDDLTPVELFYEDLVASKTPSALDAPEMSADERRREGERRVLIAGIIGVDDGLPAPTRDEIDPSNWPRFSCVSSLNGEAAAVQAVHGRRYSALVDLAGSRGVEQSICQDKFSDALTRIGDILRENLNVNCLSRQPRTCDDERDCADGVDCINPGDPSTGEKFCADFELQLEVQPRAGVAFESLVGSGPAAEPVVEDAPGVDYAVDFDATQSCANGVAFSFSNGSRPPSGARFRATYPAEVTVRDATDQ